MHEHTEPTERYLRAVLKCCNCSRIVGETAGPALRTGPRVSLPPVYFRPTAGAWRAGVPAARRRCPRCGGHLLLDEIEYVRRRPSASVPWAPSPASAGASAAPNAAA